MRELPRCPVQLSQEAILEKPYTYDDGQGWVNTHEVLLEPLWSCGPIMPTSLVDMLVTCDREIVAEEEAGRMRETMEKLTILSWMIYPIAMMSDASCVTYRYFTKDNAELAGLPDSNDYG